MTAVVLATILSMPGVFVFDGEQSDQPAVSSPLAGSWSADMSRSRLDPKMPFKEIDLTIGVTGNAVTVASSLIMPSGAKVQERETFHADGTETAATQYKGAAHVANWLGPQVFALITKKGGEIVAVITYQVSSDGQTLTARTAGPIEQTVVFTRRKP
jgi:hypothetical protein